MVYIQSALVLCVASLAHAATFYNPQRAQALKRAVDTYNYPLPVVTFQDAPKKTHVETVKSVSPSGSQGRYLPPVGPTQTSNSGQSSPPIKVSFNSYEVPAGPAQSSPTVSVSPTAAAAPAPTATSTVQRKKPAGGLGGFKYYGGSGSSSSSSSGSSDSAAAPTAAPSLAPAPVKPIKIEPAAEKPAQRPLTKAAGYDYPSPKSSRKPSKKEQKLADSKPEESAQGYHYDVGPGALAGGLSQSVQTFSAGAPAAGGMMGLSYMRQSSPYYSYHVMLD